VEDAFRRYEVFEPLNELNKISDKLAPRLEGQDMQDIDDLVKYGHKEIETLPNDLQNKVIGKIQAPVKYDRSPLQDLKPKLSPIEESARILETMRLEDALHNTLLYLASWQLTLIVLFIAFLQLSGSIQDDGLRLLIFILLPLMAILGFLMLPIRGRMIHTTYTNHLNELSQQYTSTLSEQAQKQVEYGVQLRKDVISPLTRLIEAQTAIHNQQLEKLHSTEQVIVSIESDLNTLGKRKLLGITL